MAPAQLELFKFALYVFVPIAAMLHYGDPDWYEQHVGPLRAAFRKDDVPQVTPPQTTTELKAELERLREQRLSKRFGTQQFQQISTSTSPTPSGAGVRESSLRATDFNHQPIPPRQDSASPSERWV